MNRRNFLNLAALLLLDYSLSKNAFFNKNKAAKKILIIGSGIAGLASAYELRKFGYDVEIIEARDRIGGRIWTSERWSDAPIDLGASWIHGTEKNPISTIAKDIKAQIITTSYDASSTFNSKGSLLSTKEERELEKLRTEIFNIIYKSQSSDQDTSIANTLSKLIKKYQKNPQLLDKIRFILNSELEQEYSGSIQNLSSYWFDDDKEFKGNDVFFLNGYRVITDFLSKDVKINLNEVVTEIDWNTSVKIKTKNNTYESDLVLITVPLGVLKSKKIIFKPQLPLRKRIAISKLGMGLLNKCYLRFPYHFWPEDSDWIQYIPKGNRNWTEWVSFKRSLNLPILLGFNAGNEAVRIEKLSDLRTVESAMNTLKLIFGNNIPNPVDFLITRWNKDEYSRGSYSFNAFGSTPSMRDNLFTPLNNKVFFAGEATSRDYFGTVHGAYLSGVKAAKEIRLLI